MIIKDYGIKKDNEKLIKNTLKKINLLLKEIEKKLSDQECRGRQYKGNV